MSRGSSNTPSASTEKDRKAGTLRATAAEYIPARDGRDDQRAPADTSLSEPERCQQEQRQRQIQVWQQLKLEIDSMIEGRIPSDAEKIRQYNDLSKELKGTKPSFAQEAPFHG